MLKDCLGAQLLVLVVLIVVYFMVIKPKINPKKSNLKTVKFGMSPCDGGYNLVPGGTPFTGNDLQNCNSCLQRPDGGVFYLSNQDSNSGLNGCTDDRYSTGYGPMKGETVANSFCDPMFSCSNPGRSTTD
jgi:hypothetical protein